MSGLTSTNTLKISSTVANSHIVFSRASYNYITAPASGSIAFCVNGNAIGGATSELVISDGLIHPGTTNVTSLGNASYRWSNVYSTLGDFTDNVIATKFGINSTSGSGQGISLYGGSGYVTTYGIMFATTGNYGTHGYVSGDWATYFTMSDTENRGWIFRRSGSGNVFSIDCDGHAYANGLVNASRFSSRAATGTQPYACTSTTCNTNLNADLLDGKHASAFAVSEHTHSNYVTIDTAQTITGLKTFDIGDQSPIVLNSSSSDFVSIEFNGSSGILGYLGFSGVDQPMYRRVSDNAYLNLLHTGNSSVSGGGSSWGSSITVKINGTSKTLTIPSAPSVSITNSGSGNAVTSITASGHTLTVTKGSTFSLSNHTHSYLPLAGGTLSGHLSSNSGYTIVQPYGAQYNTTTSPVTGCITVVLPASIGNTMVSMWIDVYVYSTQQSFSVHCGGYTYSNSWVKNPFAMVYGANHRVRMGHNGTNFVIYIGETNTAWLYPQVSVRNVTLGYSPTLANWQKAWDVVFSTSVSNVTYDTTTYAWTTKNLTKSSIGLGNVQNTAFYLRTTIVNGTAWNMAGTNSSAAFTIYAPTTVGTDGYVLKSNGSGAPSWVA